MKLLGMSAALAGMLALSSVPVMAQQQLSIATGGTGGVYYPLGGGYAELINRHIDGYSAVAEVTGASVENMALVHNGDSDMAIALGDTVSQAYRGEGQFQNRRAAGLRAIASLYSNAVQIVLPANSPINSIADLKGKRVSVGAPGSGTEVNARVLFDANGVTYADLAAAQRLNFNETADALRDGSIDAGVWSVGAPTSSIMNLAASRSIKLLSLSPEEIAKARAREPIFAEFTLPKGIYDGVTEDVHTLGIPNVLVVNDDMSEELAYQLTKVLYERVDDLIAIHSSARDTTVEFTLGSSPIPLHPGALRYYQEIGADVPAALHP